MTSLGSGQRVVIFQTDYIHGVDGFMGKRQYKYKTRLLNARHFERTNSPEGTSHYSNQRKELEKMVSIEVWRLLALASLVVLVGVAGQSEGNDINVSEDDFEREGDVMIDLERVNKALREMTDEQLADALFGVSPTRTKRTVNTVRDCVGFVRCLFGNYMNLDLSALKRTKRNLAPGAILKIISKFANVAGGAADDFFGKRALSSEASSSQLTDSTSAKDSETSEGMQNCSRKQCVFSSTVYRRLRNLLRRL